MMATCKECVHSGICAIQLEPHYVLDWAQKLMRESNNVEHECLSFKDSSRFVELPCKAGDRLYVPIQKSKYIAEYVVIAFWVEESGIVIRIVDTRFFTVSVLFTRDIGTTAFLTREKAEQALAKRNQPDNTPH